MENSIPELADNFRSIVKELDPKIDPFEALADYVVNKREAQVDEGPERV